MGGPVLGEPLKQTSGAGCRDEGRPEGVQQSLRGVRSHMEDRGDRRLPHPLNPTGQNKELRLPLTELQSWGRKATWG